MSNAIIITIAITLGGYLALSKRLAGSSSWKATVTPLASIMGSGFLVSAPLLAGIVGNLAMICMGMLLVLAYLVGGAWHGPVLSGYGVHLVYVHERSQSPLPDFTQVQVRALEDLQDERRHAFNEEQYAALLARYNVVIQDEESAKRKSLRRATR